MGRRPLTALWLTCVSATGEAWWNPRMSFCSSNFGTLHISGFHSCLSCLKPMYVSSLCVCVM